MLRTLQYLPSSCIIHTYREFDQSCSHIFPSSIPQIYPPTRPQPMKSKPSTEEPPAGGNPTEKPPLIEIWEAYRDSDWESFHKCIAQPEIQGSLSKKDMLFLGGMTNKNPSQNGRMVELSRRLGKERYKDVDTIRMTIARIVYKNDQQAFKDIWPEEDENPCRGRNNCKDQVRGSSILRRGRCRLIVSMHHTIRSWNNTRRRIALHLLP